MSFQSFALLSIYVLAICVGCSAAQEKIITEDEFNNKIWNGACEQRKAIPHISTDSDEDFYTKDGAAHHTYISVKRYSPPDRVWTIAGTKNSGPDNKYEEIRIGRASYSRDNGGEWKFKELGFSGLYDCTSTIRERSQSGEGAGTGVGGDTPERSSKRDFKSLGYHQFGGRKTELFQETEKRQFKTAHFELETTTVSKYWVATNGLLLKWESIQRSSGSSRWSRKTHEYDYSSDEIKIEAPIP